MAARAFILIQTHVGKVEQVASAIRQLDGVKSVDRVTGPCDIIATVETDSVNEIGNLIINEIQVVGGISRTVACLALS